MGDSDQPPRGSYYGLPFTRQGGQHLEPLPGRGESATQRRQTPGQPLPSLADKDKDTDWTLSSLPTPWSWDSHMFQETLLSSAMVRPVAHSESGKVG